MYEHMRRFLLTDHSNQCNAAFITTAWQRCARLYTYATTTLAALPLINPAHLQQRLQCGPGIQIVAASVLPDSKEVLEVSLLALVHRQQGAQDFKAPINVGSLLGVDQRPRQPAGVWCGQ